MDPNSCFSINAKKYRNQLKNKKYEEFSPIQIKEIMLREMGEKRFTVMLNIILVNFVSVAI